MFWNVLGVSGLCKHISVELNQRILFERIHMFGVSTRGKERPKPFKANMKKYILARGAERPKPFNASMENSSLAERGEHFWCVCEGGGATKTIQNKYKKQQFS